MKILASLVIVMVLLLSTVSCVVSARHDNGLHNGWYKNSNQKQHQKSMKNGNSSGSSTTVIIKST